MIGLAVFGLMAIFLLLLVAATAWGYRHAAKKGLPHGQRWLWAAGGFSLVYLPVLWDWLPTVAIHQYYCAKDSGFWIYKTVELWSKENPGVMAKLVSDKRLPPGTAQTPYGPANFLNQRFLLQANEEQFFPINYMIRREDRLIDGKSGEVLALHRDFSTSHIRRRAGWSGWKIWLDIPHCRNGERNNSLFWQFAGNFRGADK